jgi:hypothetical protein
MDTWLQGVAALARGRDAAGDGVGGDRPPRRARRVADDLADLDGFGEWLREDADRRPTAGGVGTIAGAVVGGAFLAWAPTLADSAGVNQMIPQGGLLVVALLVLPGGVVPALAAMGRAVRREPPPRAGGCGHGATHNAAVMTP